MNWPSFAFRKAATRTSRRALVLVGVVVISLRPTKPA